MYVCLFFFQAEDGIRDLVRSRGLGDVYKRQDRDLIELPDMRRLDLASSQLCVGSFGIVSSSTSPCLLYTSDAADERSSVDLGGRRIIKKKKKWLQHRHDDDHKKKHKT